MSAVTHLHVGVRRSRVVRSTQEQEEKTARDHDLHVAFLLFLVIAVAESEQGCWKG
jgi:hypothetical protein